MKPELRFGNVSNKRRARSNVIVTISDCNYLPAACCALHSCAEFGSLRPDTQYYLICDGTPEAEVDRARSFFKSHQMQVEIIQTNLSDIFPYRTADSAEYISSTTYLRLHLPDYLGSNWNRVLYIDADMRVRCSLDRLLNADLGGNSLGAVHDFPSYIRDGVQEFQSRLALGRNSPYFNAGLLLFDWPAVLRSQRLCIAQRYAQAEGGKLALNDQDVLNKVFEGRWTPLDPRWNYMTPLDRNLYAGESSRLEPWISHYTGPVKPWSVDYQPRFREDQRWYRRMLLMSPWYELGRKIGSVGATFLGTWVGSKVIGVALASMRQVGTVRWSRTVERWRELSVMRLEAIQDRSPRICEPMDRLLDILVREACTFPSVSVQAELTEFFDYWFAQRTLKNETHYCVSMPSAVPHTDQGGVRTSEGLAGHLVFGPYVYIEDEGGYSAKLTYRTTKCECQRVGVFEIVAALWENGAQRGDYRYLAQGDLHVTNERFEDMELEFSTNGYRGFRLEARVFVEKNLGLQTLAIRIRERT